MIESKKEEPAIQGVQIEEEPLTPPVECKIEMKPMKMEIEGLIKVNKTTRLDDESMQAMSSDRKETEEDDWIMKKKKNLLDRDIVDNCDKDSLKDILVLKINEMDVLYDDIIKIKKGMKDIQDYNKRLEKSVSSIKKHPITNKSIGSKPKKTMFIFKRINHKYILLQLLRTISQRNHIL